ncbi:MAG: dihydrodipicolinate synthase family protein [Woeseia sp.]|nr:dihydrodipicolinate synthase family protein [Woeseia sp.]MBT8097907.1 dihydrodipicolinate synthase family protein [Woeseia sp.]NNE60759.1 dihydrodipicolinate synthase family protein [Woeseia sp.]NNL55393.1 dihydrodipicolinate synthase family protein [Woeseia sp.]
MRVKRMSGVLCPVITPFREDLSPDAALLGAQCRWLLAQGVGLAVFGTNSEANSLSVDEKTTLLHALVEQGIDVRRMMPGTGCCALSDTVALTRTAVTLDCAGVLMLPPFYYKTVSDEGLFAYFSEVIQRVADSRLSIYLYHIPPVAQVGLSPELIERLVKTYPDTIAGIKDSSGDWSYAQALLNREWDNFRVFVGSETLLLQNMRAGGAGCISAMANVNPAAINALFELWQAKDAADAQQSLTDLRAIVQRQPMIPALKSIVAQFSNRPEWRRVRPPLAELNAAQRESLLDALQQTGFDMPGLPAA